MSRPFTGSRNYYDPARDARVAARRAAASDFTIQQAQDADREARQRHAENAAREATSSLTFETSGVGSIVLENYLKFETVFLEKPIITTGIELLNLPDRTIYELPHVTAGVLRWHLDPQWRQANGSYSRSYYLGAYVWARVSCDPLLDEATGLVLDQQAVDERPPKPRIRHHMTFTGTAYKKLPNNITSVLNAK